MLFRTQAHHNMGVPDCNLGSTTRLANGAVRKVHTKTHKVEAISKPQNSVMEIKKILLG
jgi:hypothetical protein